MTFIRLVLVPVIIVLWYSESQMAPFWSAILFVTASLTDWLDGDLARRLEIATAFGAFLDPVADKIMVSTVLLLLTTRPPEPIKQEQIALPVIIIICREVTMSALREWAAAAGGSAHKAVKVNSLGKWKTALQMTSMSFLLFCRDSQHMPAFFEGLGCTVAAVAWSSWWLLWGAAVLAMWSLSAYFANVWTHFVYPIAKTH